MDKIINEMAEKISAFTNKPILPIKAVLQEGLKDLKGSLNLNDQAEVTLDKVLQCHARGRDSLMYTLRIDSVYSALKEAREKAGRQLPKD